MKAGCLHSGVSFYLVWLYIANMDFFVSKLWFAFDFYRLCFVWLPHLSASGLQCTYFSILLIPKKTDSKFTLQNMGKVLITHLTENKFWNLENYIFQWTVLLPLRNYGESSCSLEIMDTTLADSLYVRFDFISKHLYSYRSRKPNL